MPTDSADRDKRAAAMLAWKISRTRSYFVRFLAAAPLMGACVCVSAQTDGSLQQVVVTASRSPENLENVPQSVSVITAAQVAVTPAQGLDDILQTVPGMTLNMMGPDVGHPTAYNESMRGLPTTSTSILVLVDGLPINDPFFDYIQWNLIPLDNIERVEVVRGGGAPLWGNGAMGGVVNVITKVPTQSGVTVDGGGGSFGTYRTSAYGTYVPDEAVKLSLNTVFSGTNGYQTTPPEWYSYGAATLRSPLYVPTSFNASNVQLHGDFGADPALGGFAEIDYHNNHQILTTAIGDDSQDVWRYSAGFHDELTPTGTLSATAFHYDSYFVTDNPHLLSFTTQYNSNVHTTPVAETGGSIIWTQKSSGTLRSYSVGVDSQYIDGTDRTNYLSSSGALVVPTIIAGGQQLFLGTFAEATLVPVARLLLQGSVREQYYQNADGIDTFPPFGGPIAGSHQDSFDPRLNVRFELTDQVALRAAFYRSFKAPTLDELYRTYADTSAGIYEGNPYLRPETLQGGEAGIDFQRAGLRSQLTYYSTNLHNVVTQRNLTAAESPTALGVVCGYDAATYTYLSCTQNINAASAVARGVEEEFDWTFGKGFSGVAGYTYADSHYTANPVNPVTVGQQLEGVPRNKGSLSLMYTAPSGWHAFLEGQYVSVSYGDAVPGDNLVQDAHFVLNASASVPLRSGFEIYAEAQNLLDRRYIANNGGGPPILGTPLELFAGIRLTLK